jgi:hypothetical protein
MEPFRQRVVDSTVKVWLILLRGVEQFLTGTLGQIGWQEMIVDC